jgi:hypothetical protein
LIDAWRVLRPGGLLRFQTNGVTADSFVQSEKNTWIGVSFSEAEVRALARELGAQLVSLYGAETMYCFSTLRKPLRRSARAALPTTPVIEAVACTDRPDSPTIPLGGPDACLSLLVSGIERESLDANRWALQLGPKRVTFRYAGPVRPHFQAATAARWQGPLAEIAYFEAPIPEGFLPEPTPVQLLLDDQPIGEPTSVLLSGLPLRAAKIVSVRNLVDFGTDVHVDGPKSRFTVFLEGLDESILPTSFRLRIGGQDLLPDHAGFEALVASYLLNASLPAGLSPGPALLEVLAEGVDTIPLEVDLLP